MIDLFHSYFIFVEAHRDRDLSL